LGTINWNGGFLDLLVALLIPKVALTILFCPKAHFVIILRSITFLRENECLFFQHLVGVLSFLWVNSRWTFENVFSKLHGDMILILHYLIFLYWLKMLTEAFNLWGIQDVLIIFIIFGNMFNIISIVWYLAQEHLVKLLGWLFFIIDFIIA
jgi:hypothetical protein